MLLAQRKFGTVNFHARVAGTTTNESRYLSVKVSHND